MIIMRKIKSHHWNGMVPKLLLWWIFNWRENQEKGELFIGTHILYIRQECIKTTCIVAVKNPLLCAVVW